MITIFHNFNLDLNKWPKGSYRYLTVKLIMQFKLQPKTDVETMLQFLNSSSVSVRKISKNFHNMIYIPSYNIVKSIIYVRSDYKTKARQISEAFIKKFQTSETVCCKFLKQIPCL